MGFRVKRGDQVWVCYDGKWSRRQPGVVVKAGKYKAWVTFKPWASDNDEMTAQFTYRPWASGRIWGGPGRNLGGWVPQEFWYRVYKRKPGEQERHEVD